MGVLQAVTLKMALSPNRVVPLDEEGCGKMAKAHTAPGFAGDAPFLSTQTGDRAFYFDEVLLIHYYLHFLFDQYLLILHH